MTHNTVEQGQQQPHRRDVSRFLLGFFFLGALVLLGTATTVLLLGRTSTNTLLSNQHQNQQTTMPILSDPAPSSHRKLQAVKFSIPHPHQDHLVNSHTATLLASNLHTHLEHLPNARHLTTTEDAEPDLDNADSHSDSDPGSDPAPAEASNPHPTTLPIATDGPTLTLTETITLDLDVGPPESQPDPPLDSAAASSTRTAPALATTLEARVIRRLNQKAPPARFPNCNTGGVKLIRVADKKLACKYTTTCLSTLAVFMKACKLQGSSGTGRPLCSGFNLSGPMLTNVQATLILRNFPVRRRSLLSISGDATTTTTSRPHHKPPSQRLAGELSHNSEGVMWSNMRTHQEGHRPIPLEELQTATVGQAAARHSSAGYARWRGLRSGGGRAAGSGGLVLGRASGSEARTSGASSGSGSSGGSGWQVGNEGGLAVVRRARKLQQALPQRWLISKSGTNILLTATGCTLKYRVASGSLLGVVAPKG